MTRPLLASTLALLLLSACATARWVGGPDEEIKRAQAECEAKARAEVQSYLASSPQQAGWDFQMYTGRCMYGRGYTRQYGKS